MSARPAVIPRAPRKWVVRVEGCAATRVLVPPHLPPEARFLGRYPDSTGRNLSAAKGAQYALMGFGRERHFQKILRFLVGVL